MSFQAVRAVFEEPVIAALTIPCFVDNQAFTVPDAGQEYATINLQFGQTTLNTLGGNMERLRGSLIVECFTSKNKGPGRAQTLITEVMKALNDLNSCTGYPRYGAVGWVGDMTGPAFFALDEAPFYMARLSVAVTARYEEEPLPEGGEGGLKITTKNVKLTNPTKEAPVTTKETPLTTKGVELVTPVAGMKTQEDANKHFVERLDKLESTHDDHQGHNSGNY